MEVKKPTPAPAKAASPEATNLVYVTLDHIVGHKDIKNREHEAENVEELTTDIEHNGLDTPLMVWDGGKPGNMMKVGGQLVPATFLVAGFRRRSALKKYRANDPKGFTAAFPNGIPCLQRTGDLSEMLCLHLRENVARVNPAAEDVLPVITRLQDEFGLKQNQIAKQIGKSTAYVSQMLGIKKTIGDEGLDEVKKGGVSLKDAKAAADNMKKAAKKGEKLDAKEELAKAKAKTAARKSSGRERDEKRVSAKKLFAIYKAMPTTTLGSRIELLEKAFRYLAGELESLPKEFKLESERESKAKK